MATTPLQRTIQHETQQTMLWMLDQVQSYLDHAMPAAINVTDLSPEEAFALGVTTMGGTLDQLRRKVRDEWGALPR